MTKDQAIDTNLVTFDVYHRTPSDCGDIMDRLWSRFEKPITFSGLAFIASFRTVCEAPNIEPDEQDGQHVWHGVIGFEIQTQVDY